MSKTPQTTNATRQISARFASTCPQCRAAIAVGTPIAVTHDKVWRCVTCTGMFAEIGPMIKGPVYDVAVLEAWNARVLEITTRYGRRETFDPSKLFAKQGR